MKNLLAVCCLLWMTSSIYAQSSQKHHFGVEYRYQIFNSLAQKSDLHLAYQFRPIQAISFGSSIGTGTYGNTYYSDGFMELRNHFEASLSSQFYFLSPWLKSKAFIPEPYIQVAYQHGIMQGRKVSTYNQEFNSSSIGIGINMRLKQYSTVKLAIEHKSAISDNFKNGYMPSIAWQYAFHHKKEKIQNKEYDHLSEEYMNSVMTSEQLDAQKKREIEMRNQMEKSYELMIEQYEEKLRIKDQALLSSKQKRERLLEDNFQLEVDKKHLNKEISNLKDIYKNSKYINDYQIVEALGNPFITKIIKNREYVLVLTDKNTDLLKKTHQSLLQNFEDVFIMSTSKNTFALVVMLDSDSEISLLELKQLNSTFPLPIKLMENDHSFIEE